MPLARRMHWADVLAAQLLERGGKHTFATAITPSGPIHVGNMREVLTGDAVHRALKRLAAQQGKHLETDFIYIADSYDPLRKVYPFLKESEYAQHVGKPLCDIPCPCGAHANYGEHFLEPFFAALHELGVEPRILKAHELYRTGAYQESIQAALDNVPALKEIIVRVSKRDLPPDWLPFNVQCQGCGKLHGPKPLLYEPPIIEYRCGSCGHEGKKDIRVPGEGKLPWRIDWPARWKFLDVTFEAFGKDHAAAGSSWDTGIEIVRKVYDHEPPVHTVYEFIQLKGVGAMHSSTGTAISASEMLEMTPPEVLRFLLMRPKPDKHIDFDPGLGLVKLVDEYDRWVRAHFGKEPATPDMAELERVVDLSQPRALPERAPPDIPYGHLTVLLQATRPGPEQDQRIVQRLREGGFDINPEEEDWLTTRLDHARYWLHSPFAPAEVKFTVRPTLGTEMAQSLTQEEKGYLLALAGALFTVPWRADAVHNAIHETAKHKGLAGGAAFKAVYKALLGAEKGPRAGYFLASLERSFVVERFEQAGKA
jgi:lysyl-tRNA synthetase, class I